jgi:hypothetical protein
LERQISLSRTRRIIAFLGILLLIASLIILLLAVLPTERRTLVTPVSPQDLQLPTPEVYWDYSRGMPYPYVEAWEAKA